MALDFPVTQIYAEWIVQSDSLKIFGDVILYLKHVTTPGQYFKTLPLSIFPC